ncbi:MAG: hypothetical protein MRZ48_00455 [Anaerostipes hadrus]|nr:hypothetical protein [Anaerostipes hadrus]
MNDNEGTSLTNRVCNRIEKNDYNGIALELTNEAMGDLIVGFAQVASSVSGEVLSKVSSLFESAIEKQAMLDCVCMQSQAEAMRRFNDQVDRVTEKLDLTDPRSLEAFTIACDVYRKNLETEFMKMYKPTIRETVLSIFRRK